MIWVEEKYRVLVEKYEGKEPLGRCRLTWEFMLKVCLTEIAWDGVDWINLAPDRNNWRVVTRVMNEICTLLGCFSWFYGSLKRGPIGCPETSVMNYHYTLRNIPEERRSHPLRCGSLKSGRVIHFWVP